MAHYYLGGIVDFTMVGITGKRSTITQAFVRLLGEEDVTYGTTETLPLDCGVYFLAAGVLVGKNMLDITEAEAMETMQVNFIAVAKFCERVFAVNDKAKICIIGSESANAGSYDTMYATSKDALHFYVERTKLRTKEQHLVCVAPTIIEDSNMTQRRSDLDSVRERGRKRRLERWIESEEVARIAHFALNEPALANTVIRVTGGNW